MLVHNVEAIRFLNSGFDILDCVPRHDGKSGGAAAELHVLGVCEGNLPNAVEIAAFAEEVRHSRLRVHDCGHPLVDRAEDCLVAGDTVLARPFAIALSQIRSSLLLRDLVGAVLLHDPLTGERRMIADDHESILVGANALVLFERQVDACQTRLVRTLA
jgi:hypothetical protein